MSITADPQRFGACINVADSTALAALDPNGLTISTKVYNAAVGGFFTLTVSSASLDPDVVVAVSGVDGCRWIFETDPDLAMTSLTGDVTGTGPGATATTIANLAVTAAKLAADAVTTAKILDLNVTTGKLAALAVTTAKIAALAVTAAELSADSVITAKILDLNVTTGKINDLAVTAGKLAADSVITAKILDSNVTAGKLASNSVETAKILDANVTSAKLERNIAIHGQVTATETVAAARCVTATGVKADATDDTLPPVGVSVAGAASAAPCDYVKLGPAAVLSAATPGTKYWLSETAGEVTATKPSTIGNALWLMGIAKSATVLEVNMTYLGTVLA